VTCCAAGSSFRALSARANRLRDLRDRAPRHGLLHGPAQARPGLLVATFAAVLVADLLGAMLFHRDRLREGNGNWAEVVQTLTAGTLAALANTSA
jgi:hypothetical protein